MRKNTEPTRTRPRAAAGEHARGRAGRREARPAPHWLAALALVAPAAATVQRGPSQDVEGARDSIQRWIEVRRTIAEERRNWALGQELLGSEIELLEGELETLRTSTEEARASIAEADEDRVELEAERDTLKEASQDLATIVTDLEARMSALLARLPQSMQDEWRPLSQRFPEDPATTKLSLGTRFQNVVGVLALVDKAHRDVQVQSEVRELGDGRSAEVLVLYLGTAYGFYATVDGSAGGVGTSTEGAWEWQAADAATAAAIARAIAIFDGEETAAFVQLPVEIR